MQSDLDLGNFTEIDQKAFYSYINPRDILVSSRLTSYSKFTTRSGEEIGRCYTDYDILDEKGHGSKRYFLKTNLLNEVKS